MIIQWEEYTHNIHLPDGRADVTVSLQAYEAQAGPDPGASRRRLLAHATLEKSEADALGIKHPKETDESYEGRI